MKIKSVVLLIISFFVFTSYISTDTVLYKDEAKSAFNYLNKLRKNPKLVESETGVKDTNIKAVPALKWNETLAKVAEAKASDMATNNYFSHIDKQGRGINILIHNAGYTLNKAFIKNKSKNYFESIYAGSGNPEQIIKKLVIDEGVNPPGHRNHLLALDDFYENCYDCGIGIAYNENSKYKYYTCIIIAKKDF